MALYVSEWGESANGPRPHADPRVSAVVPAMGVTVDASMECRPEALWELIAKVERIGEFSPECVEAWWVPGFPAHAVGDRFDGTPATRWTFRINPTEAGCVVQQQFEHLPDGLSGARLTAEQLGDAEAIIAMRRDELRTGMTLTLERIRAVLES